MKPIDQTEAGRMSARFRRLAGGMQKQIDEKSQPAFEGQRSTYRRERIRAGKAEEARQLRHVQSTLYALADAWEVGAVPPIVRQVNSKALVEDLLCSHMPQGRVDRSDLEKNLQAAAGKRGMGEIRPVLEGILRRTDRYSVQIYGLDEVKALDVLKKLTPDGWRYSGWGWAEYRRLLQAGITTEEQFQQAHEAIKALGDGSLLKESNEEKLRRLERDVMLQKIPGFFPSPPLVVTRILTAAGLTSDMKVLEPSAGSGAIADAVREVGAEVDCFELNSRLRDLLRLKEHTLIGVDFTEEEPGDTLYDCVLMNPPFEQMQDIDHVRHAYKWLKPGGRLVSIMSEGPFFRRDQKAVEFREWLDERGWSEQLPEGSFEASGTGVAARIVVVDK